MNNTIRSFGPAAAGLLLVAPCLLAGPLDPPAGPITGTYKTLTQVEPRIELSQANTPGDADSVFRITQSGSYYLSGNIAGVSGKSGIEIAASRVSIDLGGFTLTGVTGTLSGITTGVGGRSGIHVFNGIIVNWDADGVYIASTGTTSSIVENLHVSNSEGYGIHVPDGIVRNCVSTLNALDGISEAVVISGCVATNNTRIGINSANNSSVTNCSAYDNTNDGISAGNGSSVTNCVARNNGAYGIIAFGDATISGCAATLNTLSGINGQAGTAILDCNSGHNDDHGIIVLNGSTVRGNSCRGNASAGIFVSAFGGNRIEGNNLTSNARGLWVTGAGNVIVRNTASGNTSVNWSIVANNVVGPILNRTAPASAAISGDSAPSSLGSTDANANYTY